MGGDHNEYAEAGVACLASDDASFVTGCELYIDGGYMARQHVAASPVRLPSVVTRGVRP